MKYYRAKLYCELNSRDLNVADAADVQWERVEQEYEQRLAEIRPRLSPSVRTLADDLCLHDAELVQHWKQDGQLFLWVGSARHGHVLRYHLVQAPRYSAPRKSLPFSLQSARWLYDEVDLAEEGVFTHEILFSDGREFRVVFDDCLILETRALDSKMKRPTGVKSTSRTGRTSKPARGVRQDKSRAAGKTGKSSLKGSRKPTPTTAKK